MSERQSTMMDMTHNVVSRWLLENRPVRLSGFGSRVAAKIDEIISGLDSEIVSRANGVELLEQSRFDISNTLRFKATSGGPTYTVTVRAVPENDRDNRYDKSDVLVACSCPHFRWGGVEYHAQKGDYLYQPKTPRGDLSTPDIRDPEKDNYVCKHIYKVFQKIQDSRIYL